jgi:hypothetical protein
MRFYRNGEGLLSGGAAVPSAACLTLGMLRVAQARSVVTGD